MLYSGNENNAQSHNPVANNDLPVVTCSLGAKIGFWFLVIITIGIFYIYKVTKRNEINRMQIEINEAASGIDVQLQKRYDTLTKLIDAVKQQIKFDKETLENITALRSGISNANSVEKDAMMQKVSARLAMTIENYPKLGADSSIASLMNESTMIEKEIAAARRLYNSTVTKFNSVIYTFPTNVVISNMGIKGIPLFAASEQTRQDVKIDLGM